MAGRKIHITLLSLPENFHCRKWAQALQAAGARVSVVSFHAGQIPGVACYQLRAPIRHRRGYHYLAFPLTARRLRRLLEEIGTDVLHPLHVTPFGSWGHWSGFRPIVPAAIGADIFEFLPRRSRPHPSASWRENRPGPGQQLWQALRRRYFRYQVVRALQAADAITADNQPLRQAISQGLGIQPHKIHLIRWGIDPQMFAMRTVQVEAHLHALGLPTDRPFVLLPRGLKQLYQTEVQLAAIEQLQSRIEAQGYATLTLSAGYRANPSILQQARKLERNFNHFYLLEARLAPEQMAAIWWRTRLFLATPLFDGYSSALAEGRYVGAIPVVNAIPAHRELLTHQHNAWYVAPLTVQGLVNALATLLQDSAAWQARLAQPNQAWIQANGMLQPNATAFLALAESLLWHYRGRY